MRSTRDKKQIIFAAVMVSLVALLLSPSFAQCDSGVMQRKPTAKSIPRMLDLGRNQCLPCKMMAPILAELKREYAGIIDIEYINVAENPNVMKELGLNVRAIPFQIFYDASGKEVKRHYGYMPKEEILQEFKALGFAPKKPGAGRK
jgi:thioredoxin 1